MPYYSHVAQTNDNKCTNNVYRKVNSES